MTVTDVGVLALRLVVGFTFAAHGAQKAFGWWGGPGPQRWRGAVAGMGFAPPALFTVLSMAIELIGGLLLAAGLLASLAAAALVAQAIVIVVRAHWPKGFFSTAGGFEFPLSLGVTAAVLCALGPGALSLDAALGIHADLPLRVALLLAGVVAGVIALAVPGWLRDRTAPSGGLRRT
jgi:putative oxidoreductase